MGHAAPSGGAAVNEPPLSLTGRFSATVAGCTTCSHDARSGASARHYIRRLCAMPSQAPGSMALRAGAWPQHTLRGQAESGAWLNGLARRSMAPTHLARTGRAACALAGSTTCCLCRPGGAHRVTAVPQKRGREGRRRAPRAASRPPARRRGRSRRRRGRRRRPPPARRRRRAAARARRRGRPPCQGPW
jgi:hypothetical protein